MIQSGTISKCIGFTLFHCIDVMFRKSFHSWQTLHKPKVSITLRLNTLIHFTEFEQGVSGGRTTRRR